MSTGETRGSNSRSKHKEPEHVNGLNSETEYELTPTAPSSTSYLHIPHRGQGGGTSKNKMDPFEVRVRFTALLANLNASVTSATKTAQYAIKYRDMDEDLHSCIIEQLERVSGGDRMVGHAADTSSPRTR
jgi:hypothetical protein